MKVKVEDLKCVTSGKKFLSLLLILTVLFDMLFLTIIFCIKEGELNMNEIIQEIVISMVSGIVSSVVVTIIAYFKFLKRIPEDTTEKINKLLNDRLSYETTNHNFVLNALNPNNEYLSSEHKDIRNELINIDKNVTQIKNQRDVDYSIVDNAGKDILKNIDSLSKFGDLLVDLNSKNKELENSNKRLQQEIQELKLENEEIKTKYYKKCNEKDNRIAKNYNLER